LKQIELNNITVNLERIAKFKKNAEDLSGEVKELGKRVAEYVAAISSRKKIIINKINEIYREIYKKMPDDETFDIHFNSSAKSVRFRYLEGDINESKGYGKFKVAIYDLALLLIAIDDGRNFPRFMIHDGISDNVDKSHFKELIRYLHEKSERGVKFQYIVTLNEEGELGENFGKGDWINPSRLESEAILVLSGERKLL